MAPVVTVDRQQCWQQAAKAALLIVGSWHGNVCLQPACLGLPLLSLLSSQLTHPSLTNNPVKGLVKRVRFI